MKYNLSQAAKRLNMKRQTLHRHIKEKEISTTKNERGHRLIDASELLRVYGDRFRADDTSDDINDGKELRNTTPKSDSVDSELRIELARLEERISGKEEIIDRLEKQIAELKGKDQDQQKMIADMRVEAAEKAAERRFSFLRPSTWGKAS